jgi:uncharacterized short protein YbdD (DUF466 family)
MKSKRKRLLVFSLAAMGAVGAFASLNAASLQAGTPSRSRNEVLTAIKQAVTVGDYQSYLETAKEYRVGVPVLTETQFNAMLEASRSKNSKKS